MLEIRRAGPDDREALRALFHETERFYRTGHPEFDVRERALDRLLGAGDPTCLIVRDDDRPLAYATYAILVPPLKGVMFLKELFVSEPARGSGVGDALMKHLAQLAKEEGCIRFDWTTDIALEAAQRFYARFGAIPLDCKIYYRIEAHEFDAFIDGEMVLRLPDQSG